MRIAYVPALVGLLGLGALVAAPVAAQDATADAVEIVTTHFRSTAANYAATPADLADLAVTSAYTDVRTGSSYVYLRQRINGIEVFNGTAGAAVTRDGSVYGPSASFVTDLAGRAGDPQATLSAPDAVRAAARELDIAEVGMLALVRELPGVPGGAILSAP